MTRHSNTVHGTGDPTAWGVRLGNATEIAATRDRLATAEDEVRRLTDELVVANLRRGLLCGFAQVGKLTASDDVGEQVKAALWADDEAFIRAALAGPSPEAVG